MRAKIIGYGLSGKAAESYLTKQGIDTLVVASADESTDDNFDFCVPSPGIPMRDLVNERASIVAEVELPFYVEPKLKPQCLIGVTGTNGKTSVVNQLTQMCLAAGKPAVLCGNVGTPISRVADQLNGAIAVVEVSSFMLEQAQIFHPHIAVITNITSDHLDRHQTMDEYIRCKQKIIAHQNRHDYLVVNWDDPHARAIGLAASKAKQTRVVWYSTQSKVQGYYCQGGYVWVANRWGRRKLTTVAALGDMPHTIANALAVLAVGRLLRLRLKTILAAGRYQPRPHRLELIADDRGLVFYNDSKATNMAATLAAVQTFTAPICLILCGQTKGQDYHELLTNLPAHVVQVFVFGACQDTVLAVANELGLTQVVAVDGLTAAVRQAVAACPRPGVILFSPAGSSFDQFKNYEQRGDCFRAVVNEIIQPAR